MVWFISPSGRHGPSLAEEEDVLTTSEEVATTEERISVEEITSDDKFTPCDRLSTSDGPISFVHPAIIPTKIINWNRL